MARYRQIPFLFLLLVCFSTVSANTCWSDELYVIRSAGAGGVFVLDGGEPPNIKLKYFGGFSRQLWQFKQASRPGLYYIVNNETRNALDVLDGAPPKLVMSKEKDTPQQHWSLNSNSRIFNTAFRKNIDVWSANFTEGRELVMEEDNKSMAQEFEVVLLDVLPPNVDICKFT